MVAHEVVRTPLGQGTGTEVNPNCWTVKQSLRIREPARTGPGTSSINKQRLTMAA